MSQSKMQALVKISERWPSWTRAINFEQSLTRASSRTRSYVPVLKRSFLCAHSYALVLMRSFVCARSYVLVLMRPFLCARSYVLVLMRPFLCARSYVLVLIRSFLSARSCALLVNDTGWFIARTKSTVVMLLSFHLHKELCSFTV